jgi:hypothetical protein
MAFQPVPDTARFAVRVRSGLGDDVINVLYFRRQGAWGLPELEAAAQALATVWVNDIMTSISGSSALFSIQARGERVQDDVAFEYVLPSPVSGSRTGDALPAQCAFCVTHLTGLVGRSNRGRTYFGPLAEQDTVGDLLVAARADAFRNGLVSVRNIMGNAGWTHVVVSRVRNKVRLPTAITVPVIGYRYTDRVIDTQRRRKLGVGS